MNGWRKMGGEKKVKSVDKERGKSTEIFTKISSRLNVKDRTYLSLFFPPFSLSFFFVSEISNSNFNKIIHIIGKEEKGTYVCRRKTSFIRSGWDACSTEYEFQFDHSADELL